MLPLGRVKQDSNNYPYRKLYDILGSLIIKNKKSLKKAENMSKLKKNRNIRFIDGYSIVIIYEIRRRSYG